ncbi:DUF647-domain-containing protein [Cryphonectria parasitica EP155]|uniref:DUF647-domain-containing protein n=1 Tax=Cryphonectria parasitica (strain ATCC 38755 / EP155) TaxID=660469 RepID=A0A9P4Y2U5_CRYP1|nr:DUF647-domain-containing protein [Cryphonectria parasitica EP155]KAF3765327.1 DUF647-domain-containing protein [Cryphonectria parasitica EP155]
MSVIYDIDESGDVLVTYTNSEKKGGLKAEKTKTPLPKAILYAFLPAGFPHTVTNDYLAYQTFDSLQAFSSSITNLLANRAILEGLGVGNSSQTPTTALLLQIIQDTFSRLATILFAHRMGQAIEPECKYYRFLADIFNDCSQFLDLLLPALPLLPKVSVMVSASVLRSLCGVAANASKATLSAHFARSGNLAELNAKEASQETVVSLMGMLAGTLLVKLVEGKAAVWSWMVVLVGIHLLTNYCGVRSVKMRTLNRQRATIVIRDWLETGTILTPDDVARRESILFNSRGNMSSRTGEYHGTADFGGYGDVVNFRSWGSHSYVFDTDDYYMGIWQWGPSFTIRIAVKAGSRSVNDPLMAWFDAVAHAYHFDTAVLRDGLGGAGHYENEVPDDHRVGSGIVDRDTKMAVFEALRAKGWDIENTALETRTPVRVRVGDAKTCKGM